MNLKERAKKLKVDIPAIFLAIAHPKTPWYAKIIAGITVGYVLSPIDLVPDFIPILGYLDDVIIIPLMVILVEKLIPKEILAQCREKSEGLWKNGSPRKWYYAIPIILIWLLIALLILIVLFK